MDAIIREAPNLSVLHDSKSLWKRAFDALCKEDADILSQYAGQLSEQNKILIDKTLREREIKQWTIKLAGRSLKLRELGQKIVGFIDYSQAYLQSATSSEPHAALAWACISLLLPLVLNQKGQSETMMEGLDHVSYLIGLYMVWEELYLDNQNVNFHEAVVKLYSSILAYQARLLNYLSKNPAKRLLRNAAKVDEWETWLAEVNTLEKRCSRFATMVDQEKQRESWNQQYLQLSEQSKKLQRLSEKQDSQRIELVRSLSSDYKRLKDNNPRRVPGTCEWFIKDKRFCEWRDSKESRLLHVYAGPGCGKSVLARYLIDERLVATSSAASVLYFFFKDGQEAQQKCETAIAAMLHQFYTQPSQAGMAVHAITNFEAHGARLSKMFDELWEILKKTLEDTADRDRLMQKITEYFLDYDALQQAGGRFKILVTSRPYGHIDAQYGPLNGNSAFVRLDGSEKTSLVAAEINLVIDQKVPEYIPKVSKMVQEAIIKHLQGMDNRTYLWLHLILNFIRDNIAGRGTEKKIKGLIETLPPTINQAYQRMLSRSTDYCQAKSLLQLVIAAKRPLSISEIKVALALTQEEYEYLHDIQMESESDEQFEDSLKDLCGLLLSVHDSRVYLIHQTARDFLTQTPFSLSNGLSRWQGPITILSAEAVISRICISFLCLRDFQIKPPWGPSNFQWSEIEKHVGQWVDSYTLLRYTAEYWPQHVQNGQDMLDTSLLKKEIQLCRTTSSLFWTWYPVYCASVRENVTTNETDLIIPSWIGLDRIVNILVHETTDVNADGGAYGNALQAASHNGHDKVVQILLDKGADVNAQVHGYDKVVQILVDRGAESRKDIKGRTPLHLVSATGRMRMVEKLLSSEFDPTVLDTQGRNSLHHAAALGSIEVVNYFLKEGLDPSLPDRDGWTSLHWAAKKGSVDTIRTLEAAGTRPTIEAIHGRTPQAIAVFHHNEYPSTSTVTAAHGDAKTELAVEQNINLSDVAVDSIDNEHKVSPGAWHKGVFCDGCLMNIYGTRYKCLDCQNFDYCFKCKYSSNETHVAHRFESFDQAVKSQATVVHAPG
ncbi:hypothetical protein MMC18_004280 [Xylographa bjoerkii]|nr:hypothetical protein [Xylographa bjoerkii]